MYAIQEALVPLDSCCHERQHVAVTPYKRAASLGKPGLTSRAKSATSPVARVLPVEPDRVERRLSGSTEALQSNPVSRSNPAVLSDMRMTF